MPIPEIRMLPSTALKVNQAGLERVEYICLVPAGWDYDDLFSPVFWAHHKGKLKRWDILHAFEGAGAWNGWVTVADLTEHGDIIVAPMPKIPGTLQSMRKAPGVVPLSPVDGEPRARVDFTDVTKWRVRGIDGHEVARNFSTREAAMKALDRHLHELNLVLPPAEEIEAAKAEVAKQRAANAEKAKAHSPTRKSA